MGKLLFIFCLGQGHMNVCLSIGKLLTAKYPEHEIYFNVDEEFFDKIQNASSTFKPILMDKLEFINPRNDANFQEEFRETFNLTGLKRYVANFHSIDKIQDIYIMGQRNIEKVIEKVQPDVILMDQLFRVPYIENKGIPCGYIVSTNPLHAQDLTDYPPAMSGLSADRKKDGHLWQEYRMQRRGHQIFEKRKKWFEDCNLKLEDSKNEWLLSGTNYLNLYSYPKYADYPFMMDKLEPDGKWFRTSHCIVDKQLQNGEARLNGFHKDENANRLQVKHPGKELLTEEFMKKPGKLILFSMGTIVSFHAKVMEQLLDVIAPLPHKFVVSCGLSYDKIKLPSNCVGASFLNQVELYEIVDLCIVHGGNNTFCELFYYYKKPFILIPYFGDQPDNGARVNDLGIGISISLGNLGRKSLADATDRVTTDQEMKSKMEEAAKLSRSDNSMDKFINELHLYLSKQKK